MNMTRQGEIQAIHDPDKVLTISARSEPLVFLHFLPDG